MVQKKKLELRVIEDKGDKQAHKKDKIFDIPMRLIICGRTGSGKTSTLVSLLTDKEFYGGDFIGRNIYLFSPMINDYKLEFFVKTKHVPDMNIYTELDQEILSSLYDKLTEEYQTELILNKKVAPKLVIFDDLSFSGDLRKGRFNTVNKIFQNGRKHAISCIITAQYYTHISPPCRTNSSGLILYNMNDRQLDTIADENSYLEGGKKEFKKLVRAHLKEKHDAIVINYSNNRDEGLYQNMNFEKIA